MVIEGAAHICDRAQVYNDAVVCGATVSGYSLIHSNASLSSDDYHLSLNLEKAFGL